MKFSKLKLEISLRILIIGFISGCQHDHDSVLSRNRLFDENWKFTLYDPAGAENPDFNDSQWRNLDLPHDWSIEDLKEQIPDNIIGPFSKASTGKMYTGYTVGGTAWYRKEFRFNKEDENKIVYIRFDGIYMNSDVWINGKHVGNHPSGYSSYYYNITPFLNPAGEINTIAVQIKNEGNNARWYSGSGIYRHTWLTVVNPVHLGIWGTFVTTPEVIETSAKIDISTDVLNAGNEDTQVTVKVNILDLSGKIVGAGSADSSIQAGESANIKQRIVIKNPQRWSVQNPNLYQAEVTLFANNRKSDHQTTTFGIRTFHFDAKTGFTLNGENILIRGGNIHHDNGPLGAAAIDRAEERKIQLLKEAGFNAVRCSHNPPSPYLLDVCDRLGMLVMVEAFDMWEKSKMAMVQKRFGHGDPNQKVVDASSFFKETWQQDIKSMVTRDRNHPSVIWWSIGNEIEEASDSSGLRIARNLVDEVKKYDITRPVTEGHAIDPENWDKRASHFALLDVAGYNYMYSQYERDHEKYPERIIVGTEYMNINAFENWQLTEKHPYVIGGFCWTAMDYLGESGIGWPRTYTLEELSKQGYLGILMEFFNPDSWPIVNAYSGDMDLIGNRKPSSYFKNVVWGNSKIEMFVKEPTAEGKIEVVAFGFPDERKNWNFEGHEGEQIQVNVYTGSEQVKLELNGELVGEQVVDDSKSITATFMVPYMPGILTARCFDDGIETASETIKTTGEPAAIRLIADRSTIKADRNDLSFVMAEIVDSNGNLVPDADNITVNFEISGDADIAAVGNGNPADASSFQQHRKKSWQGRCLAIVRPAGTEGEVILKAKAEGLQGSELRIVVKE